jgi:hypothetical protein
MQLRCSSSDVSSVYARWGRIQFVVVSSGMERGVLPSPSCGMPPRSSSSVALPLRAVHSQFPGVGRKEICAVGYSQTPAQFRPRRSIPARAHPRYCCVAGSPPLRRCTQYVPCSSVSASHERIYLPSACNRPHSRAVRFSALHHGGCVCGLLLRSSSPSAPPRLASCSLPRRASPSPSAHCEARTTDARVRRHDRLPP